MHNMVSKIVPHISIVVAGMLIVLFCIDHINTATGFMENGATQILILILSVTSIVTSILAISYQRRCEKNQEIE